MTAFDTAALTLACLAGAGTLILVGVAVWRVTR